MLERISGFTAEQAKDYLIAQVESEVTHETALKIKEIEARAKDEADQRAREIVATAIQRCAADHVAEITVSVVPGPSALIAALAVSGLPTGRFTFEGFLSTNKKSRRDHLEQVKNETRTMIFYEAPHKLHACLRDMYAAWGDRRIAVVHELTKIHEEVIRTTLKAAAARYSEGNIKGEFVLVIEGAKPEELQKGYTLEQAVEIAAGLMREQGMSASEAAKTASQQTGLKKGDIYKGALALK